MTYVFETSPIHIQPASEPEYDKVYTIFVYNCDFQRKLWRSVFLSLSFCPYFCLHAAFNDDDDDDYNNQHNDEHG